MKVKEFIEQYHDKYYEYYIAIYIWGHHDNLAPDYIGEFSRKFEYKKYWDYEIESVNQTPTRRPKPFFLVLVNGNMIHSIAQGRNLRVFFNSSFSPLPQLLNPVHKHRYWFFHPRKTSLSRAYFPIFNTYGLLNIILLKT